MDLALLINKNFHTFWKREILGTQYLWVPISSIGKVSDDRIRDLKYNPCLYQKPIGVLVLYRAIIKNGRHKLKLSKKTKKKVYNIFTIDLMW